MDPCIIVQMHKEKSNKMKQCIKILFFHIYMKLNMFQGHTAHHQQPKPALAASSFSYVESCWTCRWWTLSGTVYCARQRPSAVLDSRLWAVCRSKHVELHINMEQ
jgi:hypothetical protein